MQNQPIEREAMLYYLDSSYAEYHRRFSGTCDIWAYLWSILLGDWLLGWYQHSNAEERRSFPNRCVALGVVNLQGGRKGKVEGKPQLSCPRLINQALALGSSRSGKLVDVNTNRSHSQSSSTSYTSLSGAPSS